MRVASGARVLILLPEDPSRYDLTLFFSHTDFRSDGSALHAAILLLLLNMPAMAPDTLVVCPRELRPGLTAWEELRRAQGHEILVVDAPSSTAQLQATIRDVADLGRLKYLLIVGDVPGEADRRTSGREQFVPTNYVAAKVNIRWGSQPTIATDVPYGDVDGDGLPELAVGRIPADSAEELAAVVRKVIRYEQQAQGGTWQRRMDIVAGMGGFGAVTDALIEVAASQVIRQTVPRTYDVQQTLANPASPHCPARGDFAASVRRQFNAGGLAWIYLGHGLPTELDRVPTSSGSEPILSISDVPLLRCGAQAPLAVLVACHTGAIDAQPDCLAEELLLAEQGPIAVVAATRVTMPYGNTVLGYELLRACFHDRPAELGEILRLAQRRTLSAPIGDSLRTSLDMLAEGLSPPPVDLAAERREHVWMYHLLGDPLVRLRRPPEDVPRVAAEEANAK